MEFPGGGDKLEDNSNPVLTAIRELHEETGLIVSDKKLELIYKHQKDEDHIWYCFLLILENEEDLRGCYFHSSEGRVVMYDPQDIIDGHTKAKLTYRQIQILKEYM